MSEREQTRSSDVLDELAGAGGGLTARLAEVLADVVDWEAEGAPRLDRRRAGERLLPIVVENEEDGLPPSRIIECLLEIARRLGGARQGDAELWGSLLGIVCDLAVHAARETLLERAANHLQDSAPLVELGRRRILASAVGIEDGPAMAQVVDRALRALERSRSRRLLVVLEEARRLEEPTLRQLAEECAVRRVNLNVIVQLSVD